MKTLRTILFAALATLWLFAGCSLLQKQETATAIADRAAYRITYEVLLDHPDWREHFEKASSDLQFLQSEPKLDALALIAILQRLPESALDSREARILFDAATLTIVVAGDPSLNPKTEAQTRAVLAGLITGVNRALAHN